ncbi:uncharacterized protein N0V89_001626 [Didymosphaeria variabile]|uniref:AAA+ ATPase domain-containing protein n=1 Tax=Didymosphaeria variabile TaxID=1932322 RepID=A0A9W8XWH9_9PLEO|nr:uncharacterized protein N0V89_001626 [Didymosphaeria variabile]KAJ4361057.1 hypothetical protein N0V89_001626 [Didymosphaeria variabile]
MAQIPLPFDRLPAFMNENGNGADGATAPKTWRERQEREEMKKTAVIEATPKEPAGPPGSLASIHNVYADPWMSNKFYGASPSMRKYALRYLKWSTQYPTRAGPPAEDAYSLQHALVARYKLSDDPSKTLDLHSIVVQSPLLKKSLGKVLDGYPGITTELERVEINAPFECFVHRWDCLQAERVALTRKRQNPAPGAAQRNKDAVAHLEALYRTLESELASVIREKEDLIAHGVMRFDKLWTLFEPGCLVYQKRDGHDRVYKLKSAKIEQVTGGRVYKLECQYVDFDGTNFGYNKENISIKEFKGTKKIAKFEAYPLEFYEGVEELKARLMERGAMFEAYKEYRFVAYDGIATGKVTRGEQKMNVKSRIIIDAYSASRYGNKPSLELFETPEVAQEVASPANNEDTDEDCVMLDENVGKKQEPAPVGKVPVPTADTFILTPEQRLVASATVRGYSLRDKKWCSFFISSVCDITWNEDAFASLVAPQEQKDLILSFAESQVKSRDDFDDFIQGKGQGIIMLLAGPPGVGKTLTAESVAEAMKAPLYSIGAADLGSECYDWKPLPPRPCGMRAREYKAMLNADTGKPAQLENKLHDILEMCAKWNAVLLIDEADVFMETRSPTDLDRNKLVAIFLRLLEYFSGIMFLTTNRLAHMDAAFESRIHLTLNYTELDKASRKHIWASFLTSPSRMSNKNRNGNVGEGSFGEVELEKLSRERLNGRQIKNVVKTAGLLAGRGGGAWDGAFGDGVEVEEGGGEEGGVFWGGE